MVTCKTVEVAKVIILRPVEVVYVSCSYFKGSYREISSIVLCGYNNNNNIHNSIAVHTMYVRLSIVRRELPTYLEARGTI